MPKPLLVLLVPAVLTLFILVLAFHSKLLQRLKRRHPETWKSLGSPTLLLNNSIANSSRLLRFVHGKHYLELNDDELNRTARRLRAIEFAYVAAFLLMMLGLASLK